MFVYFHVQNRTIKEFRNGIVNILVATAVVEEGKFIATPIDPSLLILGLDIPQCDLVVRFNKPNNFSSYMQSKGRARAKKNSCYVLFMDKSNDENYLRDQMEYQNYEEVEKVCFSRRERDTHT